MVEAAAESSCLSDIYAPLWGVLCASLGSSILDLEALPEIMLLQGKPWLHFREVRVYGLGFRVGPAFTSLLVCCATRVSCSITCSFCIVFEL